MLNRVTHISQHKILINANPETRFVLHLNIHSNISFYINILLGMTLFPLTRRIRNSDIAI